MLPTSDARAFALPGAFGIWTICSEGESAIIKPKAPIQDLVFLEVSVSGVFIIA